MTEAPGVPTLCINEWAKEQRSNTAEPHVERKCIGQRSECVSRVSQIIWNHFGWNARWQPSFPYIINPGTLEPLGSLLTQVSHGMLGDWTQKRPCLVAHTGSELYDMVRIESHSITCRVSWTEAEPGEDRGILKQHNWSKTGQMRAHAQNQTIEYYWSDGKAWMETRAVLPGTLHWMTEKL